MFFDILWLDQNTFLAFFFLRYFIKLLTLTSRCHSLSLTLTLSLVPVPVAAKPSACPQGPVNPEACTLPPCAWLMLTVSVPKNRHFVHLLE